MQTNENYYLRLLKFGHFERRAQGGWRFGAKIISDPIVDRLISNGRAEIVDDRLALKPEREGHSGKKIPRLGRRG